MLSYRHSRGVGIVDIMIGLFIGSLVSLAAYATLMVFRNFERTGVSANTALENGTMAIYAIEHDVKMAGLGFIANNAITCNTLNASFNGVTVANNTFISPVIITPGAAASLPDSLNIIYGATINGGAPAATISAVTVPAGTTVNTWSTYGMQAGDAALLGVPGGGFPCTLINLTAVTNNGINTTLTFDPGNVPATTYPANSQVTDIGALNWVTWTVANNQLQVANNLSGAAANTIADNIVQLKAQYGVTNGVSQDIAQWVSATGIWAPGALTAVLSARIRAVRIAVVARSTQQEKPVGGACTTTTVAPLPWPGGTAFDLSANANWRCFRYQVYTTVVPLKNVLMGGVL